MISDKSRKNITNAALIYVLAMMVEMFIVFLNVGDLIIYLQLVFEVIKIVAIIWLIFGFLNFYGDEKNKLIMVSTILLFIASLFNIVAQALYMLHTTGAIAINPISLIPTHIVEIIAAILMTVGFYQLKTSVDSYATARRNIYKGQMSLPMAFGFLTLSILLNTIIPTETYISYVDGLAVVEEGYEILLWINYFLDMGSLILTVLGFWYLRRAFLVLDKVPDEVFDRIQQQKEAAAQRQQAGGAGLFGRRGGLFGGFTPPPPTQTQTKPDPLDDLLIEEDSTSTKKMFCVKCGLELDEDSAFCAECGEPNPYLKDK